MHPPGFRQRRGQYVAGGLAPAPGGESNMCQKKRPMGFVGSPSVILDRTEPKTVREKRAGGV